MIKLALVAETILDRGTFMPSAQEVTGHNHVSNVDKQPGVSRLHEDLRIMNEFAGYGDLEYAITFVTFMVAGFSEDIEEFICYTRGMPHFDTNRIERRGVRCILIAGNLDQWAAATVSGCRAPDLSPVRLAFNEVYRALIQKGMSHLFEDYRTVEQGRGTFLLELHG